MRTRLYRTAKGSNQYRQRERYLGLKPQTLRDLSIVGIIFIATILVGREFKALEPVRIESPLATRAYALEIEKPEDILNLTTPQQQQIAHYIREVFGKDADKAFAVLSCENASLNPKAVNTAGNEPAGSRDIGVFQINEYWQGVNGRFLFNWKINVQIAHQIFTENGNSFERWTCGRRLGV